VRLTLIPGSCPASEHTSHFYETFISFETSRNMPENLKTGMEGGVGNPNETNQHMKKPISSHQIEHQPQIK
jgi:hypothetical protein